MSELNRETPLLPKGRTIPINGDAVRTRRILGGWPSPGDFADELGMSEDRLIQIERGGAKVYARTLIAIASNLKVDWKELLAEPIRASRAPAEVAKKLGKSIQFVIPGSIRNYDDIKLSVLIEKARQISGVKGEIIVITVEEGASVVVTVEMGEDDARKFVAAFHDGKLKKLGITRVVELDGPGPVAKSVPKTESAVSIGGDAEADPLNRVRRWGAPRSVRIAAGLAASIALVALVGLLARYWLKDGTLTTDQQLSSLSRRISRLASAPPDSPAVRDARRDALRLRLEAYGRFSRNEALRAFVERTEPTAPAAREAELKSQIALVTNDSPAGSQPRRLLLFNRLPPGLQPGASELLKEVRDFAARSTGPVDPALAAFLARSRLPTDQLGMIVPACFTLADAAGREKWSTLISSLDGRDVPVKIIIRFSELSGYKSNRFNWLGDSGSGSRDS